MERLDPIELLLPVVTDIRVLEDDEEASDDDVMAMMLSSSSDVVTDMGVCEGAVVRGRLPLLRRKWKECLKSNFRKQIYAWI